MGSWHIPLLLLPPIGTIHLNLKVTFASLLVPGKLLQHAATVRGGRCGGGGDWSNLTGCLSGGGSRRDTHSCRGDEDRASDPRRAITVVRQSVV
jgi:hypothetical protein